MSWPESRCSSGAQARALAVRTERRAEDGAREGDGRGIIFVRLAQGGSVASMSCLGTLGACRPAAGPGDSEARLTRRGDHHECVWSPRSDPQALFLTSTASPPPANGATPLRAID